MNKIFVLIGPTASGKSNLSLKLSKDFPFEIINADLYSIYDELNIGTAKPCDEELRSVKHHLINIIKPDKEYDVSKYCRDAKSCIDMIISKNKYPLIVGGSMMYIYQLLNGLSHEYNLIQSDRKLLNFIIDTYSTHQIYKSIKSYNPNIVEKINENDKYRIEKLLERLISKQITSQNFDGLYNDKSLDINIIFIDIENRNCLRENIFKRTNEMLEKGFINEVKYLISKYELTQKSQSMKAIGYKEIISYLLNETDKKDLLNLISISTQQLAKRQITWKNKFDIDYYLNYPNLDYDRLYKFISKSLH